MVRILLVENDSEWLGIIRRSLPEYQVDLAQSYDDAMEHLNNEVPYDIAIVDLNLIDSPDRNTGDLLGGEILRHLQRDYPMTQRIVLTGWPPSDTRRRIFEGYGLEDLLYKGNISVPDLRDAVRTAVARTQSAVEIGSSEQTPGVGSDVKEYEP